MTRTQLTALCRGIEQQHFIELAMRSGVRFYGIPERVRIDLSDVQLFGEVIFRSSRGVSETVRFVDIAAVRCLFAFGEA